MNYKALEDLINILVKKAGTNIDADLVGIEENRIAGRVSKLQREKESQKKSISSKKYIDLALREKDEAKRAYLEKTVQALESNKKNLTDELNTYYVKDEHGETAFSSMLSSIAPLEERIAVLKREVVYAGIIKSEKHHELSTKYKELLKEGRSQKRLIERKKYVEEELARIEEEIGNYKSQLDFYNDKLENGKYSNNFERMKDDLVIKNIEEEIASLERSLNVWETNPEVLGKHILKAYLEEQKFETIEDKINSLMGKASDEFSTTKEEINGSNIFQEMEKYNKLIDELKDKISNGNYHDSNIIPLDTQKESYYNDRLERFKYSLSNLEARKTETLDKIQSSKEDIDKTKNFRLELESDLSNKQERLNNTYTKHLSVEESKELDRLINGIREDIESQNELETNYVMDMYSYKEELKKIDIEIVSVKKKIANDEKSLQRLQNKEKERSDLDKIQLLEDKILLIEYKNRLESIKNQQQYLYVDPKIIKEEIRLIWTRNQDSDGASTPKVGIIETEYANEEVSEIVPREFEEEKSDTSEVIETIETFDAPEEVNSINTNENIFDTATLETVSTPNEDAMEELVIDDVVDDLDEDVLG